MSIRVIAGDCRTVLPTLPGKSIQCCVTSPPYFGLRDYGTASWDGGDAACDHVAPRRGGAGSSTLYSPGERNPGAAQEKYAPTIREQYRNVCGKCGAVRVDQQIGLESTVEAYVSELVDVFREVRRVLRDDGVLLLNLGDSYAASTKGTGGTHASGLNARRDEHGWLADDRKSQPTRAPTRMDMTGLKPKDLIGIPWRVALALQADGWYLRSDIIWAKPNPMPESVRDRPTKSHEYIFLLTKSARYFWDADAVAEPSIHEGVQVKTNGNDGMVGGYDGYRTREGFRRGITVGATRNIRSVWTIATQPYADAHFATFPPALAERCIKAGSKAGDMVLDPFGGAGTVGLVADRLGRDAILVELNPEYAAMARTRITSDAPMFAQVGD